MNALTKLHALIHEEAGFRLVAGSLTRLLTVTQDEHSSSKDLVDAILQQVGLTERLLNLANAVGMRSSFTQSISTVQGAALLLGTDNVRRIAVMLTTYEGIFRVARNSKAWLREFQVALVASELARRLSARPGFGINEECATASLMRGVSRMLLACAAPKEWQDLISQANRKSQSLESASKEELGLSYSSISQSAASAWCLPTQIYEQVAPVARPVEKMGTGYSTWVRVVSACAYEVAESLLFPEHSKTQRLHLALRNFPSVTPDSFSALEQMLEAACADAEQTLTALGLQGAVLNEPVSAEDLSPDAGASSVPPHHTGVAQMPPKPAVTTEALGLTIASALGEIAVAVIQGGAKQDMFNIAVEGLSRGLGARRAALVLRNRDQGAYLPAAAFNMSYALKDALRFSDRYLPDIISAVVANSRDFYIEDPARVQSKLPVWYVQNFGTTQPFAVFPLSKAGEPVGFLYVDWPSGSPGPLPAGANDAVSALKSQLVMVLQLPG